MLLLILVIILLFGGGGFYGYRGGGFTGPMPGIVGLIITVVLIILVFRLLGAA